MSGDAVALVLFDLDGTLVDTAVDLHAAANALCARHGRPPVELDAFRPLVSKGGRAMLELAFERPGDAEVDRLLPQLLELYGEAVAVESRLFDGMADVLEAIESSGQRWGVVTNKPERLALGVLEGLDLHLRCGVLVGGDTLHVKKPDPLPLQEACRRLGVDPLRAIYVGDDRRDIVAAHAAGMPGLAAGWGYISADDDVHGWGADAVLAHPGQLREQGWLDHRRRHADG